ncbi:hypothetical protein BAE44_0025962, partial [Dichanthelium oligosanthes]
QLVKRNWPGEIECKLCSSIETTDHIIFGCAVANFVWCVCRDALGWQLVPTSADDFLFSFVWCADKNTRSLLYFLFGCVAWSLWLIRNDLVFNNVVIPSPEIGVYRVLSFMQRWAALCNMEDQKPVEELRNCLQFRTSALRQHPEDGRGSDEAPVTKCAARR